MGPWSGGVDTWVVVQDVRGGIVSYTNHDALAATEEVLVSPNRLRFRTEEELTRSLADAGFAVEHMYGDRTEARRPDDP